MEQAVKKEKSSPSAMKRSARLLAVQAVYQFLEQGGEPAFLVAEYLSHRAEMVEDGEKMVKPDGELFKNLTFAVIEKQADWQGIVDQNRPQKGETPNTPLEPLLNAILLCGTAELTLHQATDFPIIISDYVEITKAFYEGREPALINAILDSIRKLVRTS